MRGPLTYVLDKMSGAALGTSPLFITGHATSNGVTLIGLAEKASEEGSGSISPWASGYLGAGAAVALMHAKATAYKYGSTIREQFTAEETGTPMLQGEELGEFTYFLAFQGPSTRAITNTGAVRWTNEIRTWNGKRVGKPAKSPRGSQYIKTHLERLWAFGGTDPQAPAKDKEATMYTAGTASKPAESRKGLLVQSKSIYDRMEIGDKIIASTGAINLVGATITALNGYSETPSTGYEIILSAYTTNETGTPELNVYTNVEFEHKSGAKIQSNALYYSEQEGPLGTSAWTTTSPINGLVETNKIVVGAESTNDFLVGGAVVNQNLLIFKRHSIWYLTGYSPETFVLRKLTNDRGCVDPWSICEANGGIYFLSQSGFEFFDGSEFHSIDGSVSNTISATAKSGSVGETVMPFRCQVVVIDNDYLMVNVLGAKSNTFANVTTGCWLYHVKSGSWAEVTSNALAGTGKVTYCASNRGDGKPWIFDGEYLTACPYLTKPEETTVTYDANKSFGKVTIPSEFETNRIDLTSNGTYTSQLHRFMLDYAAPLNSGTDSAAESVFPWEVTLYDDSGKVISANGQPYSLEAQGAKANTKYIEGRRFLADTFNEAVTGIKMKVAATSQPSEGVKGEIYNATVEVQTARQRRKI